MELGSVLRFEKKIIPEAEEKHQASVQEANEAARRANHRVVHGKVTREDLDELNLTREYLFNLKKSRIPGKRAIIILSRLRLPFGTW